MININNLRESSFIKNIIILSTGTIGAQFITFAASPVITRVYGPEAFGVMGSFIALMNIFIPIAALTYPIAIVLPKKIYEVKLLVKLSYFITIFISLLFLIIILISDKLIISLFKLESIATFLYFLPIAIFVNGILQIFEQSLIRENKFKLNAKVTFYQSLILNSGMLLIGLVYPYAIVLIFFTAIKSGMKALMMYLALDDRRILKVSKTGNYNKLITVAKKYIDFPIYRAPETFISALSQSIPILLLSMFFGPIVVGFFTIGKTVLSLPAQLIGKAVGDVFYPKISELYNSGQNINGVLFKSTFLLSVIGLLPFVIVILFGPFLFGLVFGSEWSTAGEYARWIAVWSYFSLIYIPCIKTLPVIKAQKFHFVFSLIAFFVRTCSILIGYYIFSSAYISVMLFSIVGAILSIFLIILTFILSRKSLD